MEGFSEVVGYRSVGGGSDVPAGTVVQAADGGLVAIQLLNALSTDGFSLKTSKNGKGQISLTLTGHVSINAQNVVPMVFYSLDP